MELVEVLAVVNGILLILSALLGKKYRDTKKFLKELAEAIEETYKAIEDNKVTEEELKNVIKQWRDVLDVYGKK